VPGVAKASERGEGAVKLQGETTLTDAEKVTEARKHVEALVDHVGAMAPNEAKFISDLEEKFERYGDKTFISTQQLFWLRDIRMNF
jgi:hypothetical protein